MSNEDIERKAAEDAYMLSQLSAEAMAEELRNRKYIVIEPAHLDTATGLIHQGTKYYDPDTGKEVDGQEAYRRASGGY